MVTAGIGSPVPPLDVPLVIDERRERDGVVDPLERCCERFLVELEEVVMAITMLVVVYVVLVCKSSTQL